jgi:hypothetical protein
VTSQRRAVCEGAAVASSRLSGGERLRTIGDPSLAGSGCLRGAHASDAVRVYAAGRGGLANGSGNIPNGFELEYFVPRLSPGSFSRTDQTQRCEDPANCSRCRRTPDRFHWRAPVDYREANAGAGDVAMGVPFGALLTDRNRVEFRLVNGVYSWRARDQLRLEKDVRVNGYALTGYVSAGGVLQFEDGFCGPSSRHRGSGFPHREKDHNRTLFHATTHG